ncbi:MAG: hypothetical protein ACPGVJ_11420 [Mangrovicoccus sp.]
MIWTLGSVVASQAVADLVVTEFDHPLGVVVNAPEKFDLNQDGIEDVAITYHRLFTYSQLGHITDMIVKISGLNGTVVGTDKPLGEGMVVGPMEPYFRSVEIERISIQKGKITSFGKWHKAPHRQQGFLPLQLVLSNRIHFGWMQINMTNPGEGVLVRAAVNQQAGKGLMTHFPNNMSENEIVIGKNQGKLSQVDPI